MGMITYQAMQVKMPDGVLLTNRHPDQQAPVRAVAGFLRWEVAELVLTLGDTQDPSTWSNRTYHDCAS